jgi:hypothetical protein
MQPSGIRTPTAVELLKNIRTECSTATVNRRKLDSDHSRLKTFNKQKTCYQSFYIWLRNLCRPMLNRKTYARLNFPPRVGKLTSHDLNAKINYANVCDFLPTDAYKRLLYLLRAPAPSPSPLRPKTTQQIGFAKAIDACIWEVSTSNFDCAIQQHLLKFFTVFSSPSRHIFRWSPSLCYKSLSLYML